MFSRDHRRTRRSKLDRSRPPLAALECLEARELLAYTPLGFSLPDLSVKGFASTVATWSGSLTVTLNVSNTGASTFPEPFNQVPGSVSSADAPASVVDVFASTSKRGPKNADLIGTVNIPAITQNNVVQVTSTITLPSKPANLPGDGGLIYLYFEVNPDNAVLESDTTNNVSPPVPLLIEAPFPELAAISLDVPPTMQPGDTIQPNIRIANFGTTNTNLQGPVTVELVASTTPTFNVGSSVVAVYTVANIPPASDVASQSPIFNDSNLNPAGNIVTIVGDPVTLPTSPGKYYLGVVVDPNNQIKEIGKIPPFTIPTNPFSLPHVVQTVPGLPPAGLITAGGAANVPVFPFPIGGIAVGGSVDQSTFPAQINTGQGVVAGGITAASAAAAPTSVAFALKTHRVAHTLHQPSPKLPAHTVGHQVGESPATVARVKAASGRKKA